jgi:uncharacterized membrane-anchored protein
VNRRELALVALVVVAAAQLAVPAWMIAGREKTLRAGQRFKFRTQPVDPADAFRGRYVWLRLEPDAVRPRAIVRWTPNQRAYAVLAVDSNGFATVERLERARPAAEPSIAVRIGWAPDGTNDVHFSWPIDRYYMEERKAPAAEAAYRAHSARTNRACHVTVRVRGGDAVLEELFIEGRPVRDYLREQAEAKTRAPRSR